MKPSIKFPLAKKFLGIGLVIFSVLYFVNVALAVPVNTGKIKLNVLNELRDPVVGAEVFISCDGSNFFDTNNVTNEIGSLYLDPTTVSGANCVSGNNLNFQIASDTFSTQTYPVAGSAPAFYADIDPNSSDSYHDGSTNVYNFGVETTGSYSVSYWNMGGSDTTGSPFPTSDPVATSSAQLANWSMGWNSSPAGGVDSTYWYAKLTKTITTGEGWYQFDVSSDDGSRLKVDGASVSMLDGSDNLSWSPHSYGSLYIGAKYLSAGTHTIEIQYFQFDGFSHLGFSFFPVNVSAPILSFAQTIISPLNDNISLPEIVLNSSVAGNAVINGSCTGSSTVVEGQNFISFSLSPLDGEHSDCSITVTDPLTGLYNNISIPDFVAASGPQSHTINSCSELQEVGENPNTYYDQITLGQSIDCNGIDFQPLSFGGNSFGGTFDGAGNSISNLVINKSVQSDVGLFSVTDGATLSNVALSSGSVTGQSYVGSLVGRAFNTSISGVSSSLAVSGSDYNIGGVVGSWQVQDGAYSTFSDVEHDSTVNSSGSGDSIGGVVGFVALYDNASSAYIHNVTSTGVVGNSNFPINSTGGVFGDVWVLSDSGSSDSSTLNISNIYSTSDVFGLRNTGGLIGVLDSVAAGAPVNISITSSTVSGNVTSTDRNIGGFIGSTQIYFADHDMNITVSGNSATGNVDGQLNDEAGGFIGDFDLENDIGVHQEFDLTNNFATGNVNGGNNVGGFIGGDSAGQGNGVVGALLNCTDVGVGVYGGGYCLGPSTGGIIFQKNYATGSVVANGNNAGGFAGYFWAFSENPNQPAAITVDQCYATGSVVANGTNAGGFIGQDGDMFMGPPVIGDINISNSYSTGSATADQYVGGFAGVLFADPGVEEFDPFPFNDGLFQVYSTGTSTAITDFSGGLVGGMVTGFVTSSFTMSPVVSGGLNQAGMIGDMESPFVDFSNTFFDENRTGQVNAGSYLDGYGGAVGVNGDGVDENPAPDANYFFGNNSNPPLDSWNFDSVWVTNIGLVPTLQALDENAIPGAGTFENPYRIGNCIQLQNIIQKDQFADFILSRDVDCTGVDFQSIDYGEGGFSGTFNGHGHVISNLNINSEDSAIGLFKYSNGASFSNFSLVGGTVHGGSQVGSVVGLAYNTDWNFITSTVEVVSDIENSVGGIAGISNYDDTISHLSTHVVHNGPVTGAGVVGGLFGSVQVFGGGTAVVFDSMTSTGAVTGIGGIEAYQINNGGFIGQVEVHGLNIGTDSSTTFSITNSFSSSSVYGSFTNGGFIGTLTTNAADEPVAFSVVSSSATGDVTTTVNWSTTGGFIGNVNMSYAGRTSTVDFINDFASGNIVANGDVVGGFVGWVIMPGDDGVYQRANFFNDYASGNITAGSNIGGFIGTTIGEGPGVILNYSESTGGLVIDQCYATGNVTGYYQVGGFGGQLFCGSNNPDQIQACSISQSYATGNVSGLDNVGGFAGLLDNSIDIHDAYAVGTAYSSDSLAGGFVGYMDGVSTTIERAYATGNVDGGNGYGGGFIGYLHEGGSSISNSFSTGAVTGVNSGGFLGGINDDLALNNDYFDLSSSLQNYCGTDGYTNDQCFGVDPDSSQTDYFFHYNNSPMSSWDFGSVWQQHNQTHPTLRMTSVATVATGDSGSNAGPTEISSCEDLQNIANGNPAGSYILSGDVDCTGVDFQPIDFDVYGFQGALNGQGHTISNLNIDQSQSVIGLFKIIDGGTIKNINISSSSVQGNDLVGGLAGISYNAVLENISSTINVSTKSEGQSLGGLVGSAYFDDGQESTWTDLTVGGELLAFSQAGGLVGYLEVSYAGTSLLIDAATSTVNVNNVDNYLNSAGGLIGEVAVNNFGADSATSSFTVQNSFASSTIYGGTSWMLGGFIGHVVLNNGGDVSADGPSEAIITSSTSKGSIFNIYGGIGGFIGNVEIDGFANNSITVSHCSSANSVNGDTGESWGIGGFIGYAWILDWNGPYNMQINLSDDHASGDVIGAGQVGGFLGTTEGMGPFVNLYDVGATGGLNIEKSYATGNVTAGGQSAVGGFVGELDCQSNNSDQLNACTISQSFASGNVTGASFDLGGFVGEQYGATDIHDAYATGAVTETEDGKHVGGFVGQISSEYSNNIVVIRRSYATGQVNSTNDSTGGFLGQVTTDLYSITDNFTASQINGSESNFGGFVGSIVGTSANFSNDYFDQAKAGTNNCDEGGNTVVGCHPANVDNGDPTYFFNNSSGAPFSNEGAVWNFPSVWTLQSSSYPLLTGIDQLVQESGNMSGSGTLDDPYIIRNCSQLQNINDNLFSVYKLGNDIDCSGTESWNGGQGFLPLGDLRYGPPFLGFFDGAHHTISNLHINGDALDVGLFSFAYESIIQNVTLDGGNVISSYDGEYFLPPGVAGLVGWSDQAVIRGVSVKNMSISGLLPAGGVVGIVLDDSNNWDAYYYQNDISYSSSINNHISANGLNPAGGLVGVLMSGHVDNTFASSTISGDKAAGGLIGEADGLATIRNSYSIGMASSTQSTDIENTNSGLGSLVGDASLTEIDSSFAATTLINNGIGNPGAIIGTIYDEVAVLNDYFDATTSGSMNCIGNYEIFEGCVAVNLDGMDNDHFKATSSTAPFNVGGFDGPLLSNIPEWDFVKVWQTTDSYPSLRSFVAPPQVPENISIEGDYNVSTTVSWSAPSSTSEGVITGYLVEVQNIDDGYSLVTTTAVGASTYSASFAPNSIMSPSTTYLFLVRALQDGPENAPLYGLAGESDSFFTSGGGTPPVLTVNSVEYTEIYNYRKNRITVSSDSVGSISFSGGCSSTQTNIPGGDSIITINPLPDNITYSCSITLTSDYSHLSTTVSVPDIEVFIPPVVELNSCDDLQHMLQINNEQNDGNWNTVYKLGSDIDCTNYPFTSVDYGEGSLGTMFDGQGHTITNLNIFDHNRDGVGLFRFADNAIFKDIVLDGGRVVGRQDVGALVGEGTNLTFENITSSVSVASDDGGEGGQYIGGLVGGVYSDGAPVNFDNVFVSGGVFGGMDIGGLVGHIYLRNYYDYPSESTISNSHVSGVVQSDYACAGGLVGWAYSDNNESSQFITVTSSYSSGNIFAYYPAGGIVGCADEKTKIFGSYSTGDVSAFWDVGGLVGEMAGDSHIDRSFATGKISSRYDIDGESGDMGGMVGYLDSYSAYPSISNSYSTSNVDGLTSNRIGGLVGDMESGIIVNSYASGNVTGTAQVGGLVGYVSIDYDVTPNIENSYAAGGTVTGQSEKVGGLVGDMNYGIILHSFSADLVRGDATLQGGLVGYVNSDSFVGGAENLYDKNRAQQDYCFGNDASEIGCDFEDGSGDNAAYFYASTNTPMSTWNSDTVWNFSGISYPTLFNTPSVVEESVDHTPPAAVTSLNSTLIDGHRPSISWVNPLDSDFGSVIIRNQYNDFEDQVYYPFSVYDGYNVDALNTSTVSTDPETPEDGVYSYSVFAVDKHGNASDGATTTLTVWLKPRLSNTNTDDLTTSSVTFFSDIITPDGTNLIERGVYYGIDWSFDHQVVNTSTAGNGTFSISANDLSCGSNYVYYAYAINENGERQGSYEFFTTPDCGAPTISNISATPSTSSVSISWNTDHNASTRVEYSPDESFGSNTYTDESVTDHSVVLSDLVSCTNYWYRVLSTDSGEHTVSSSERYFVTTGCPGNGSLDKQTLSTVDISTTSRTILDVGNTFIIDTPTNFTSSSVVIQIKAFVQGTVLDALGKPSNSLSNIGEDVFDVKALIDSQTILDSFDLPVTVTYNYSDGDLTGLDESTIRLYHYHNGAWIQLDDCSLNTAANSITCTTPSFSIFAAFAGASTPAPQGGGGGSSSGSSGVVYRQPSSTIAVVVPTSTIPLLSPSSSLSCSVPLYLKKPVRFGSKNDPDDVKLLEKYLNTDEGYNLPVDGIYSKTVEKVIIAWQEKYATEILKPYSLKKGTGYVYTNSLKKIKAVHEAKCASSNDATKTAPTQKTSTPSIFKFKRTLKIGSKGEDVRQLQIFLNQNGFPVDTAGVGSLGNESANFGKLVAKALANFQEAHADILLAPFGLKKGNGIFGPATMKLINSMQ